MQQTVHWTIDSCDTIADLGGDWLEFAEKNQSPELSPDRVIGRDVWRFISGAEVRCMYRQMVDRVRATAEAIDFRYRCDAPDRRRNMRMQIEPAGGRDLHFSSRLIDDVERPWLNALDRYALRSGMPLDICSVCRRIGVSDNLWVEPERAADEHHALLGEDAPPLVERLCDDCVRLHSGVRYLVSDYTGGKQDDLFPLVVFLHGGGQERYLLRMQAPPRLAGLLTGKPFLLLSPVDTSQSKWHGVDLDGILEEVIDLYPVDPGRIHVTGNSAGAIGAWNWARTAKRQIASLSPIAGFIDGTLGYPSTRVWAAHGACDDIVPMKSVMPVFEELKRHNSDNHVTIFEHGSHDVWSRTYRDPAYWEWMLG